MKKRYIYIFLVLLLGYVTLSLTLPTDPKVLEKYNLTQGSARLLSLSIVLPLCAIYLTALYGFLRFNEYSESIRKTKEGPYFKKLASGLLILTFSLPITSLIGSLYSQIRFRSPDMLPEATIFRNYLALAFAFAAILMIARGTEGLFNTLKNKKSSTNWVLALASPIALASLYTWLITAQGLSHSGGHGYFMPDWLVIITITIPYVFIWCVGFRAAYQLYKYKTGVKGIIYKRAFDNLAKGVGAVVLISVLLQLFNTLSEHLNKLDLNNFLIVIYVLLLFYVVGYGFIARGAKKLKQIEEA